jgi:methylated-DNA-[protein]-cysteine S-methyltransferase
VLDTSQIGRLWIAWVGDEIAMIRFGGEPAPREERERWMPGAGELPVRPIPVPLRDALSRYFAGEAIDPATLPVRIGGTRFQHEVWSALRKVPRGSVRTYAGLAADVGSPRAMRAIGMAMAHNPLPIVVPCHRVVAAGLALGGFSGGLDTKRALLALEGVKVEGDRVLLGQLDLL